MRKTFVLGLLSLGLAVCYAGAAAFTPGNVVVLQCVHSANGGAGTLVEFNRISGATGNQVALPFASGADSGNSIAFGNNSTLNHDITLSGDGAFVVVGGYAYAASSVDSSTTVPRVVALVKYDGTYSRPFSSSTVLSGTSVRSCTSDGFGNFWGNGNGGTIYFNTGTAVQTTASRVTAIFNGNLCFSVGNGAWAFTGLPTAGGNSPTQILPSSAMSSTATASSFAIPTNIIVGAKGYLVDYNGNPNAGIGHFHWNGSAWQWDYNITLASSEKPQHIAVDYSGTDPVLYVTPTAAAANKLYYFVDSGPSPTQNTLATAPAGNAFRGLSMAPTQPPPSGFIVQPQGQTNNYGESVTFGPVEATGANPNGYTWMHAGTNLIDGSTGTGSVVSGATSNTLTISGIGNPDRGCYYAVARNNGPTTTLSDCAFLELKGSCINPTPTPLTLCAGSTANFSGGISGCPPPVTGITWTWNGGFGEVPLANGSGPSGLSTISGADTPSLTIQNVQEVDAGVYKLSLYDGNGSNSVASATLVVGQPVNFGLQPVDQDKMVSQTVTFQVSATGNVIAYQWNKDGAPLNDGPTGSGSGYLGTHTATFTITNVQLPDAGTYTCVISNVCLFSMTSAPAVLSVGAPPVFTNLPVSLLVTQGVQAVFVGQATGTGPITYSWKHDGVPLYDGMTSYGSIVAGSDSDTLQLSNVQANDARSYTITASNRYGTTSAGATLTVVIATPKPQNIPGLIVYEPFNYPVSPYPGFPAPAGWTNCFEYVVSAWNEVTHQPALWEKLGQSYSTIDDSSYGQDALVNSGQYPWKGIDCFGTRDWYWSSAPNNNHFNFGGVDQTNGAAYFSFVLQVTQGSALSGNRYDLIAGLTTGTGSANADNWNYKLCTHSSNGGDAYQLGVFKGGGNTIDAGSVNGEWVPLNLGRGGLHFIVGCYKFNHGTNLVSGSITNDDVLTLWVDPDRSTYGASEANLPTPGAGGMVTNWGPNAPITGFGLRGAVEPASKRITDLRIGTTWASVTRPYYPKLQMTTTATDVTLSWPAKDTPYNAYDGMYHGYFLQSAPDLTSWSTDLSPMLPDASGTNWTVTEGLNAPQFFRLVYP